RPAPTRRPAPCSTGRRATFVSGWDWRVSTICRNWRRSSRRWPTLTSEDKPVRLHKLLAQSGIASRRRCEELMLAGRVTVDGEVVTRLGTTVDPERAVIRVDGVRLPPRSDHVYVAANKPLGVVSTMSDPQGRPTL